MSSAENYKAPGMTQPRSGARVKEGLDQLASFNDAKGQSMSIELTDTQFVMLSDAARREDRCLVALPSLKGGAKLKVANKLISTGFVTEIEARVGAPVWRSESETGQAYTLRLTAEGAKAIGLDEDAEAPDSRGESRVLENHDPAIISSDVEATAAFEPREPAAGGASAPRTGSKLAQVIDLLRQDGGATIDELIGATGWLAHTTRAALTGLRKRGYAVEINRKDKDRGSFYRIRAEDRGAVLARSEELTNFPSSEKPGQRLSKPRARRAA
jgi:hypothetical protein